HAPRPFRHVGFARQGSSLHQQRQPAHHHVMRICDMEKLAPLLGREGGNRGEGVPPSRFGDGGQSQPGQQLNAVLVESRIHKPECLRKVTASVRNRLHGRGTTDLDVRSGASVGRDHPPPGSPRRANQRGKGRRRVANSAFCSALPAFSAVKLVCSLYNHSLTLWRITTCANGSPPSSAPEICAACARK